jgi:hypothetical protein
MPWKSVVETSEDGEEAGHYVGDSLNEGYIE